MKRTALMQELEMQEQIMQEMRGRMQGQQAEMELRRGLLALESEGLTELVEWGEIQKLQLKTKQNFLKIYTQPIAEFIFRDTEYVQEHVHLENASKKEEAAIAEKDNFIQ